MLGDGDDSQDEHSVVYDGESKSLTQVPDDIPLNATKVNLSFNRITRIRAGAFSRLSECTWLSLYSNRLTSIEAGGLQGKFWETLMFLLVSWDQCFIHLCQMPVIFLTWHVYCTFSVHQ